MPKILVIKPTSGIQSVVSTCDYSAHVITNRLCTMQLKNINLFLALQQYIFMIQPLFSEDASMGLKEINNFSINYKYLL